MRALLLLCSCGLAALAQVPLPEQIPNVRASGEGVITTRPDQAVLHIGVVTQGQTAEAAGSQNARQSSSVIAELKQALGSSGEIKTVGYSLTPNYRYPRDGGTPSITGYSASNTLEVRVNELSKIGQVIDVSTRVGANNIGGIQYGLRNEQNARAEALAEASRSARANAEAMASALGLKVLRVRSAEAAFVQAPRPMMAMAAATRAEPMATPVETGTIEVRATVTITLDVAQ